MAASGTAHHGTGIRFSGKAGTRRGVPRPRRHGRRRSLQPVRGVRRTEACARCLAADAARCARGAGTSRRGREARPDERHAADDCRSDGRRVSGHRHREQGDGIVQDRDALIVPRFKLTIEYAGGRYSGWQIQPNARTIQGELDRAIREVSRRREFELYGAGRTDAGVHALAQVAHLELYTDVPPATLRLRINEQLPSDIHILSIDKAPHKFHARHDAVSRSYLYQIARRRTAFFKPFVWWIKEPLDITRLQDAAAHFVGMNNFASFTADEPEEKSTKVLVGGVEVVEDDALLVIRVQGSHFLWRMVRRIVGVLAAVG